MKKSHSKLSKNQSVWMRKQGWCVGLGWTEGGSLREEEEGELSEIP